MSEVQLRTRDDAPDRIRSLGTAGAMLSMSRRGVGGSVMKPDGDVEPKSWRLVPRYERDCPATTGS